MLDKLTRRELMAVAAGALVAPELPAVSEIRKPIVVPRQDVFVLPTGTWIQFVVRLHGIVQNWSASYDGASVGMCTAGAELVLGDFTGGCKVLFGERCQQEKRTVDHVIQTLTRFTSIDERFAMPIGAPTKDNQPRSVLDLGDCYITEDYQDIWRAG